MWPNFSTYVLRKDDPARTLMVLRLNLRPFTSLSCFHFNLSTREWRCGKAFVISLHARLDHWVDKTVAPFILQA